MKTRTPLFIALLIAIAIMLSMVSCQTTENPIHTEGCVVQDVYLNGSILYYKDKPAVLQDSVKDLLRQGIDNLPRVAAIAIEYKGYYHIVLN